jgi:hypothetical protein
MLVSVVSGIVRLCQDFIIVIPINKTLTTYYNNYIILISCLSGKVLFVFWQGRPEEATRLLTLNKDYGLVWPKVK